MDTMRIAARLCGLYLFVAALLLAGCGGSGGSGSAAAQLDADTDGDGLSDRDELLGWEIQIDRTGNGTAGVAVTRVTSDPKRADTDGDGLDDLRECKLRTDPRSPDTDRDGLTDHDEWSRTQTNPTSVDTDGDARGPDGTAAPNPALFDGNEFLVLHTSPTLTDTDGDARSDFEEFDDPQFHPLIAELPQAELVVDGDIDVRLNVEYAETVGVEKQYGTTLSTSTTDATSRTHSKTHAAGGSITVGIKKEAQAFPPSTKTSLSASITASYNYEWGRSFTRESSTTARQESSRYRTDSRDFSETSSSGTVSVPMRLKNLGQSTFTLTNLGVTVLHWVPGTEPNTGAYKAVATLGTRQDGFTLSPGEVTPILEVSETEVDAGVVKQFLAHPNALSIQPAVFDLRDERGIDFDFITQTTYGRTALVEIDFGDAVESYRVATNVRRGPGGSYEGITMAEVMNDVLGLRRGDAANGYTLQERTGQIDGEPVPEGVFVLASVRGRSFSVGDDANLPRRFWAIISSRPEHADPALGFDDIVVHAGDEVRIAHVRDQDGDGLYEFEEGFYGTSDTDSDTDRDGIDDAAEIKVGWLVRGRRVHSDPRAVDSDGDGMPDGRERELGTDPTEPDTDGDGLGDGADPFPKIPAVTLHVDESNASPGDGTAWSRAFVDLQAALADADRRNADAVPSNDVSQIWVARGIYVPGPDVDDWFALRNKVRLLGGFAGDETKVGARDPSPLTNGTTLSGERRNQSVVYAGPDVDASAEIDGFSIENGFSAGDFGVGAGMLCDGLPSLRNLLFFQNEAAIEGGGLYLRRDDPRGGTMRIEDCVFFQNSSQSVGGGIATAITTVDLVLVRCSLTANVARSGGAGLSFRSDVADLHLVECRVAQNRLTRANSGGGAGVYCASPGAYFEHTDFFRNDNAADNAGLGPGGAVTASVRSYVAFTNCRFWSNRATGSAAINAAAGGVLQLTNCTIADNWASSSLGAVFSGAREGQLTNNVLWGNVRHVNNQPRSDQLAQLAMSGNIRRTFFNNCVQGLNVLPGVGSGNIGDDPRFAEGVGNLRLQPGSPCVDAGANVVDVHPGLRGRQPLPATDLDGNPRVVDGGTRRGRVVDMGAYELQDGAR